MTDTNSFHTGITKNDTNQSGHSRFAPGEVLAERYKVDTVLGIGGMGVVYKVEQIFLRKIFAMKTLEIEDSTGVFWRRFQQEGSAVSRLDHPNVVKIYDFGLLDGRMPFYVMEFVDGISLSELLKKRGSLEIDDALKIFIRVSMALQHAHETDIVHRDIKPSNVMLQSLNFDSENCVKLVDFGIAKLKTEGNELQNLTRTGDVFGSPLYMSPEQCLGIGVDHRTDIYSFGCALFEALTGSPPHIGENSLSTMIKHREELAPSLADGSLGKKFPAELEAVVAQLLRKDPAERYQNFGDVTEDLVALANGRKTPHVKTKKSNNGRTKLVSTSESALTKQSKSWWLLPLTTIVLLAAFAWYALRPAPKHPASPVQVAAIPIAASTATTAPTTPPNKELEVATISPEIQALYDSDQLEKRNEHERCYDREKPFSTTCVNANHQRVRVFQFPNEFSLGILQKDHRRYTAKGDVLVDVDGPLGFTPSYVCCERATLLDNFRPDEIDELSIVGVESARDEVISHLDNWKELKKLNIKGSEIGDRGLHYLADDTPIVDLVVTETPVTGKGVASLKCVSRLERIEASMIEGISDLIKGLRGSKNLQTLNIRRVNLTDDDLKIIATMTSLKDLDISENKRITDQGIKFLDLPKLRGLAIRSCNVTEASFPHLQTLPKLNNISVGREWSQQKDVLFHEFMPNVRIRRDSEAQRFL